MVEKSYLYGDVPLQTRPVHWEEDGYEVTRTLQWSPHGCHPLACGLRLYVKDGRLEKVEGDENQPITGGALCIRCLTYPDYVHHPDRIIYPMKRDPKNRGKDKWERISWDEAWALVKENADKTIQDYGRESIAVMDGTGRQAGMYAPTIAFRCFGSPNICYMQSGWSCYGPRMGVTIFTMGIPYMESDFAGAFKDRYDDPRFELPECIMLWGKEPLKSNPDGFWGHSVIDMMRRGTKLIVVDPRLTFLASKAEHWLQLRPGTDGALALAMLNVIINEDLYDHDFVEKWTFGFEELRDRVQAYTPEWAEGVTWVPKEKIVSAARFWAKSSPASLCWGVAAADQKPNGMHAGLAMLDLVVLTGNIDIPGGNIMLGWPAGAMQWEWGWRELPEGMAEKQLGLKEYPAVLKVFQFAHPDIMLNALETEKPYPIKFVWINSANPIANPCAVPERYLSSMSKVDYCVATDLFMTPSVSAFADLVLPLSTCAEMNGVVSMNYGAVGIMAGAISKALQVGECKSDIEIMIELGKLMRPELWDMYESDIDVLEEVATRPMFNMSFAELAEKGWVHAPYQYRKYEKGMMRPDGQPGFMTPTGRIELYSTVYEGWEADPLPYYEEPPFSPVSTPELSGEYPFVFTSGARNWSFFHSENRHIAKLREIRPEPRFEINPEAAAKLDIIDGEWCWIENMFGRCKQKALVTPTIDPRVINCDHGWWYPERQPDSPVFFDALEANPNNLVPHETLGPLGFGAPFKCMICRVYKA